MNFFRWAQGHARSILFLMVVVAASGIVCNWSVPVSLFPQVEFPRIALSLDSGDRPAERMVAEVTRPTEESLRAMPGVRGIRSTTSRGTADVFVDFDWGQDMTSALLQAESQVNKVLPTLPAGTTFEIERRDPTVFPVIAYSLTSKSNSLASLHDLAQYEIRPELLKVNGVAKVDVQGGEVEEFQVIVDPVKLRAFGLKPADVAASLSAANVLEAVGRIEDHDKLYLVVCDTQFRSMQRIEDTILRSGANGVVRLTDVAMVRKDVEPHFTRATADGQDAVLLQIFQQPGGNTVEIAREIHAAFERMKDRIPAGVQVANWYDQGDLIKASAHSVQEAVLIGVALAALVLLVFLRNWRITLIASLVVPTVLATTILMIYVLGMSFNMMTLGGMAAAVGLIVDNAIVMVEHIIRRVRGGEGHFRERVMQATAEFTRPLAGSSASTIVIFAPLAFLTGVTGAFFKALSLTMAASLVVSFVVSWLGVPVLAARLLRQKDAEQKEGGFISDAIGCGYGRLMGIVVKAPWLVLLAMIPCAFLAYYTFQHVGEGFMPTMDEGGFIIDYRTDPGTSLTQTDALLRQIEDELRKTPELDTYSRRTGLQLGGGVTEANEGDFFVRLNEKRTRDIEEVMKDVRDRVGAHVPGVEIDTKQLLEDLIGDLTAVPQPIEVKLYADDEKLLTGTAAKVHDALPQVPGLIEIANGTVLAGDALNIQVDRVKAALEGMDVDDITKAVNDQLAGTITTQIQSGPKLVGVRVWIPKATRSTTDDVGELPIRAGDGHTFPLKRVATITAEAGQPQIMRENLRRMVTVTARIEGRDLGSCVKDVEALMQKPDFLPPGVSWSMGGLAEQERIARHGLMMVLGAAVVLVFLLLLFMYERFRVALAMLIIPVLAAGAVYGGLWLTKIELNISARMGMTMIVGIVTEVAIFYYSEFRDLPVTMPRNQRLIAAGVNRMRPIAMTTLAAILALLPLALGVGKGSAMLQPLAVAIISGLAVQLPLVLIAMPAFLVIVGADRVEE